MNSPLPVIAIDGPSASGKGSIARGLAAALGYAHLETGLLYRYVGRRWLEAGNWELGTGNLDRAAEIAQTLAKNFSVDLLNNPELRSNQVAEAASVTSSHPPVRAALLELQREFAKNPNTFTPSPAPSGHPLPQGGRGYHGAILDGRDIATVVCPDAPIKLFVTASPEIRAARRTKELQLLGEAATYEQVLQEVRVRDHRDQTREVAPLMPTAGSITIDTSNLSAEDAIGIALGIIRRTTASAGRTSPA